MEVWAIRHYDMQNSTHVCLTMATIRALLVLAAAVFPVGAGKNRMTPSYCLKPKAPGKTCGGGPFTSWYFDSNSLKCKGFIFGGCNGNLNRFSSEAQCQRWCLRGVPKKEVCSLAAYKGHGNETILAWSYDPKVDQCRAFVYSGAGGNANSFPTCYQCMEKCSGRTALLQKKGARRTLFSTLVFMSCRIFIKLEMLWYRDSLGEIQNVFCWGDGPME